MNPIVFDGAVQIIAPRFALSLDWGIGGGGEGEPPSSGSGLAGEIQRRRRAWVALAARLAGN